MSSETLASNPPVATYAVPTVVGAVVIAAVLGLGWLLFWSPRHDIPVASPADPTAEDTTAGDPTAEDDQEQPPPYEGYRLPSYDQVMGGDRAIAYNAATVSLPPSPAPAA